MLLKVFELTIESISVGVTDRDKLVCNTDSVFLDVVNFVNCHQEGTVHAGEIPGGQQLFQFGKIQ